MSDLSEWIKERRRIHNAATEGPWYKTPNDRILSESVQWPEGDDYDVAGGLGRDGAVVEAIHDFDGNAITDAHNTLPALLTAVENVLELHKPVERRKWWAGRWEKKTVCEECTSMVNELAEWEHEETEVEYPCPTVQAIEGASNHE